MKLDYIDQFIKGEIGLSIQRSRMNDVRILEDEIEKRTHLRTFRGTKKLLDYWLDHTCKNEFSYIFVCNEDDITRCYNAANDLMYVDNNAILTAGDMLNDQNKYLIEDNEIDLILKGE